MEIKYKRLKKIFIVYIAITTAMLLGLSFYIYKSYNYLVFKHLISENYLYMDELSDFIKDELTLSEDFNVYEHFDVAVANVFLNKLQERTGDKYTYLYTPKEFKEYEKAREENGKKTFYEPINDNTLYMKITNFSKESYEVIKEKSFASYKNLILDLRDNSGGDLSVMKNIGDMLLPKGDIIYTQNLHNEIFNFDYKSDGKYYVNYDKIIILQNKNTASASETLICALKDNLDNVMIIGEDSFGKGIGQLTLNLKKGYKIKSTFLEWTSPNGYSIHRKGVIPHIHYDKEDIVKYAVSLLY